MGGRETHFELFLRKSPKASWALVDAIPNRQKAIERANAFLKSHPQGGIKVMKEERKGANGDYIAILVAALGDCEEPRKRPSRTFIPQQTSSCVSAGDLRKVSARKTYLEVIPRFLERHRVLPGELIYRTDLLEILESSGSEITQAIQRVAIARAGEESLHAIARQLHELVNQGVNSIFKEKKAGRFVKYEGTLEDVVKKCRQKPNLLTAFKSALADRLMRETSWPKKLTGLVEIWKEAETLEEADRKFVNEVLTDYFSEWIDTPGAVSAILGETQNTGEVVDRLIGVLEPRPDRRNTRDPLHDLPHAQALAEAVQLGLLPTASQTIVSRIFEHIGSNHRLYDKCLLTEFNMLKDFGDRLVKIMKSNRHAEMYDAFCARSKRLMSTDTVDGYLERFEILDRPMQLLKLQDNLVGYDARTKMITLLRGMIGQPRFEEAVMNNDGRHVQVLMTLRATQAALLKSDLPEAERIHGAQDLDALGVRLISNAKLFPSVARKAGSPALAAVALFRLAAEALPKGQSSTLAAMSATKMLKEQDAREALKTNPDLSRMLRDLSQAARAATELPKASEG